MFCMKCGAQLPDGAKFCMKCGTKIAAAEAPGAENPSDAQTPGTTAQVNSTVNPSAGSSAPAKPPKKKKGAVIAASIGGAAVVAVGATAALNWSALQNTFARTFSSPEEYYQRVEGDSIEALSASIAETYGSLIETSDRKNSYDGISGEFTLKLEDKELLSQLAKEADMDVSWLSDMAVSGGLYAKDSLFQGNAALRLGGTNVVSADLIYDMDSATAFLAIPELSDKYVSMEFGGYIDSDSLQSSALVLSESQELLQSFTDLLPDESKVKALTAKYMILALKCLDDVDREKNVTLTAGDIEQKCTRLTVTVDADTVEEILETVCKELADDKDVKKIILDFCNGLRDNDTLDAFCRSETAEILEDMLDIDLSILPYVLDRLDADEVYNLFHELCLELSRTAKDIFDDSEDIVIEVSLYVDKKGSVRGREININNGLLIWEFANLRSGSNAAYKIAVTAEDEELFTLSGTGKESGGKFSGKFTLTSESYAQSREAQRYDYVFRGGKNTDILAIDAKNFDLNGLKHGYLNGSFTMTSALLNYQVNRDMGWLYPDGPSRDLAFTLDSSMSESQIKQTFGLKDGKDSIGSVGYALKLESGSKISAPSSSSVLPLENQGSMEAYWNSIKWAKFAQTLDDAGLPAQLSDAVKQMEEVSFRDLANLLYYLF